MFYENKNYVAIEIGKRLTNSKMKVKMRVAYFDFLKEWKVGYFDFGEQIGFILYENLCLKCIILINANLFVDF